jgi:hypothetical protein
VCGICSRHQGQLQMDLKRRIRDHIDLWREALADSVQELQGAHAAEVDRLESTINGLRSQLSDEIAKRPLQVVNHYVGQDLIDEALENRARAYHSRDQAFRDMTLLHMLHFEVAPSGKCRCGKLIDDCEEAGILESSRALRGWERKHAERRRRGEPNLLPDGHPGIVDARWDPDDDSVAEFEDRET